MKEQPPKSDAVCTSVHPVAVSKQRDREAHLARFQHWRSATKVPKPEDDHAGVYRDVSQLPLAGLTDDERGIVQSDATALVERLGECNISLCNSADHCPTANGALTAVTVTTAFAKAAVVAQDVTNCLTEVFIEEGLRRAEELDEYYRTTGKVVGPLHGLPVRGRI